MRWVLALPVAALFLCAVNTEAQERPVYYCDPLHVYYPTVTRCPVPWRAVAPPPSSSSAVQALPAPRPGADIHDQLSDWCAEAQKASSIVICSDGDLRQMAMIRTKIFADARRVLSRDDYKKLLADQQKWLITYTSSCGVPIDGPVPSSPIPSSVIDCYTHAAQDRIADLVSRLRQQKPDYYPTALSDAEHALVDQALSRRADEEKAEREKEQAAAAQKAEQEKEQREQKEAAEAEKAKEQLRAQAAAEQQASLARKLKDRGFKMKKPVDFELDWRDLEARSQKVALRGKYIQADGVDGLIVDDPDLPLIRLYTDSAPRVARKMLLECRVNATSPCDVIVGADVISCVKNKGELNEKDVPCLQVDDVFVDPTAGQ